MKCIFPVLLLGCLLFAGCTTYTARIAPGADVSRYKNIFVENNLNDNHRIDVMLVNSLKAAGLDAQSGPPTMMPDDAQAIIRYTDHWTWDFSEHITGLEIELIDTQTHKPVGGAYFTGPVSLRKTADSIADQLVKELFRPKSATKKH
jgi:hypothetical protein